MNLREKLEKTHILLPNEKTLMRLLVDSPLSSRQIAEILLNSPYEWTLAEIVDALNRLKERGLLRIDHFRIWHKTFDAETFLTFSDDWIFKI